MPPNHAFDKGLIPWFVILGVFIYGILRTLCNIKKAPQETLLG